MSPAFSSISGIRCSDLTAIRWIPSAILIKSLACSEAINIPSWSGLFASLRRFKTFSGIFAPGTNLFMKRAFLYDFKRNTPAITGISSGNGIIEILFL